MACAASPNTLSLILITNYSLRRFKHGLPTITSGSHQLQRENNTRMALLKAHGVPSSGFTKSSSNACRMLRQTQHFWGWHSSQKRQVPFYRGYSRRQLHFIQQSHLLSSTYQNNHNYWWLHDQLKTDRWTSIWYRLPCWTPLQCLLWTSHLSSSTNLQAATRCLCQTHGIYFKASVITLPSRGRNMYTLQFTHDGSIHQYLDKDIRRSTHT